MVPIDENIAMCVPPALDHSICFTRRQQFALREPAVTLDEFSPSSINFTLYSFIGDINKTGSIRTQLSMAILDASIEDNGAAFPWTERAKMERSFVRSAAVEKRELSKIDLEMIDDAFKALLQSSHPDPVVEAKIVDLRDKFRDAFAGWLEIEEAA
jgi:hypothetical protein